MSCCGKRRMLAGGPPVRPTYATSPRADAAPAGSRPLLRVVYEYVGQSALTVTSPTTGKRYRFDRPGARVDVDPRDRGIVGGIGQLRQVT